MLPRMLHRLNIATITNAYHRQILASSRRKHYFWVRYSLNDSITQIARIAAILAIDSLTRSHPPQRSSGFCVCCCLKTFALPQQVNASWDDSSVNSGIIATGVTRIHHRLSSTFANCRERGDPREIWHPMPVERWGLGWFRVRSNQSYWMVIPVNVILGLEAEMYKNPLKSFKSKKQSVFCVPIQSLLIHFCTIEVHTGYSYDTP